MGNEGLLLAYFVMLNNFCSWEHLFWQAALDTEETSKDNTFKSYSLFRSWGSKDRKVFSDSLAAWVERWEDWRGPAAASIYALSEENNFDGHRLINACKWIETTPGGQQVKVHERRLIRKIVDTAEQAAKELGIDFGRRLENAIFQLRSESRQALIERLVGEVAQSISVTQVDEWVKDIVAAFGLRGSFAHAKFYHEDDEEFGKYVRATKAVECLGFLLMIKDLPLPKDFQRVFDPYVLTSYIFDYHYEFIFYK